MRILLVEDDPQLGDGLSIGLRQAGFAADWLRDGEAADHALLSENFDFVVLDLGLPGLTGMRVLQRARQRGQSMPILILTARDALDDRVVGLDAGGDDYLLKPFLLPELLARVRALIRRSRAAASLVLKVGELALDVQAHRATLVGEALELTGREWNVLEQLALAVPRVVAKQKLADSLSQWDKEITPNAVEIYVSRLRAKLAGSRVGIRTVRGIGYRLEAGDAAAG